jgi:hypothetical protein
VKPGVHLVEITAAPPAPAHSGSGARHHTGSANPDGRRKHFHRDLRGKIIGAKDFSRRPLEGIVSLIADA